MKPCRTSGVGTGGHRLAGLAVALAGLLAPACLAETHPASAATRADFPSFTPDSARSYLEEVSAGFGARAGDRAAGRFIQARLHSALGQQEHAGQLARAALALEPARADIRLFLADLLIRQDRLEEAGRLLAEAVSLQPALEGAQRRLGLVRDRLGDRDGARRAFETAVQQSPTDATAHLLLGRLLLDQGQIREAIQHLERACRLEPDSANAFYTLSQAQLQADDRASARTSLRTFQELKRAEQARADADNLARDDAREMRVLAATTHTEMAVFFLARNELSQAEAHLRQAVAVTPDETLGRETLASFYLQGGRLPEARGVCEELVRIQPANIDYRINLGTLNLELRDFPTAQRELEHALTLDPRQPVALQNLTRFYLTAGRNPTRALELGRRLVEVEASAAHYDLLAWACHASQLPDAARRAAARSVELDPANPVYRERLRRLEQLR